MGENDGEQVVSKELASLLEKFLKVKDDPEKCNDLQFRIKPLLLEAEAQDGAEIVQAVMRGSDLFVRPSHWIIGGDGWAYDIGFGGVDHVLASNQNINILVLDTEGYSNTGAQVSK